MKYLNLGEIQLQLGRVPICTATSCRSKQVLTIAIKKMVKRMSHWPSVIILPFEENVGEVSDKDTNREVVKVALDLPQQRQCRIAGVDHVWLQCYSNTNRKGAPQQQNRGGYGQGNNRPNRGSDNFFFDVLVPDDPTPPIASPAQSYLLQLDIIKWIPIFWTLLWSPPTPHGHRHPPLEVIARPRLEAVCLGANLAGMRPVYYNYFTLTHFLQTLLIGLLIMQIHHYTLGMMHFSLSILSSHWML